MRFLAGIWNFFKGKSAVSKERKEQQDQVLGLFVEGERLIGIDVTNRLTERTERRRLLSDVIVHGILKELVASGKLKSRTMLVPFHGVEIQRKEYFLPE